MSARADREARIEHALGLVHRFLIERFKVHARLYLVICGILVGLNIWTGNGWWTFWPVCGWAMVLAVHYFYVSSAVVDESWVQERTDDLKMRSYDLGHIMDLKDRVAGHDRSVRPGDERDGL